MRQPAPEAFRPAQCLLVLAVLALPALSWAQDDPPSLTQPAASASPRVAEVNREPPPEPAPRPERTLASFAPREGVAEHCADGLVQDDGGLETGYGFVPGAEWGQVVQAIDSSQLPSRALDRVCVCWLRTRLVDSFDFDVSFYADAGGRPASQPYATVPARAFDVPKGKEAGGKFVDVDVTGVFIPEGKSYVGVHWDPGAAPFTFVCVDTSEETEKTVVFQRENLAPSWFSTDESKDPIFRPHRAAMVRTVAYPPKESAATDQPASEEGASDG